MISKKIRVFLAIITAIVILIAILGFFHKQLIFSYVKHRLKDAGVTQLQTHSLSISTSQTTIQGLRFQLETNNGMTLFFHAPTVSISYSLKTLKQGKIKTIEADHLILKIKNGRFHHKKQKKSLAKNSTFFSFPFKSAAIRSIDAILLAGKNKLTINIKGSLVAHYPNQLILHIDHLDLAKLLSLLDQHTFQATGKLSGDIPMLITSKGLSIQHAKLLSLNGGIIEYHEPTLEKTKNKEKSSLSFAQKALSNLHYSILNILMNHDAETDETIIKISAIGKNPDLKINRPVHLNITLTFSMQKVITHYLYGNNISNYIQGNLVVDQP